MSDLYGIVKKSDLENIADAIRDKTGLSNSFKVHSMASIIETIGAGQTIQDYLDGKYSGVFTYSGTTLGLKFLNQSLLTEINLPNVISGGFVLQSCALLSNISMPKATNFPGGNLVFNCPNIERLYFPELTRTGTVGVTNQSATFINLTNLSEIIAPKLSFALSVANNCPNLVKFSASSNCLYSSSAFNNCSKLSQIYPSYLGSTIGDNAFNGCSLVDENVVYINDLYKANGFTSCNFKSIHLPKAYTIQFSGNQNLTLIDCPNLPSMNAWTYASCPIVNISTPILSIINSGFTGAQLYTYKGAVVTYSQSMFNYVSNLFSVYLMTYSWPNNYSMSNGFIGTPMMDSTIFGVYGSVYVPSSRYTWFATTNTYTKTLASRYVSMTREEECEFICAYEYAVNNTKTSIDADKLNAKYIGHKGFDNCNTLNGINLSQVTNIAPYAINQCNTPLVSLPNIDWFAPGISYIVSLTTSNLTLGVKEFYSDNMYNCTINGTTTFTRASYLNVPNGFNTKSIYAPECLSFTVGNNNNQGVNRVLDHLSLPKVEYIGKNAFMSTSVSELYLPKVTTIDGNAFSNCSLLTTVDLPEVERLEAGVFYLCNNVNSFSMPKVQYIGENAINGIASELVFPSLTSLGRYNLNSYRTYVEIPNVQSLDTYQWAYQLQASSKHIETLIATNVETINENFYSNGGALINLDIANVQSIKYDAFANCYNLTSINIPNCSFVGDTAFRSCKEASIVNLNKVETIGQGAFQNCSKFSTTSMSKVTSIGSNAFANCYNLVDLYLMGTSVPTIQNNTFANTPLTGNQAMTSSTPHIYVRPDMYNAFVNDSRFNSFASIITSYIG